MPVSCWRAPRAVKLKSSHWRWRLPSRGRGLGRALLHAAIVRAQQMGAQTMFLEVGADNPQALALYAGLGFAKVGARKGYYASGSGGTDALVLRLSLPANFA